MNQHQAATVAPTTVFALLSEDWSGYLTIPQISRKLGHDLRDRGAFTSVSTSHSLLLYLCLPAAASYYLPLLPLRQSCLLTISLAGLLQNLLPDLMSGKPSDLFLIAGGNPAEPHLVKVSSEHWAEYWKRIERIDPDLYRTKLSELYQMIQITQSGEAVAFHSPSAGAQGLWAEYCIPVAGGIQADNVLGATPLSNISHPLKLFLCCCL